MASLWGRYFFQFWRLSDSGPERFRNLANVTQLVNELVSPFWLAKGMCLPSAMGDSGLPVINLRPDAQCRGAELGWLPGVV